MKLSNCKSEKWCYIITWKIFAKIIIQFGNYTSYNFLRIMIFKPINYHLVQSCVIYSWKNIMFNYLLLLNASKYCIAITFSSFPYRYIIIIVVFILYHYKACRIRKYFVTMVGNLCMASIIIMCVISFTIYVVYKRITL